MKRYALFYGLLFFLPLSVNGLFAQRVTVWEGAMSNFYAGEAVATYDLRPRTMEGSLYLFDDPRPAAVKFRNGKAMNGKTVKYNLENDGLEVFVDENIYFIPGSMISEFALADPTAGPEGYRRFIRSRELPGGESLKNTGFLAYDVEGPVSLLTGYEVEILKPNYVPALDAGSLNSKAYKKERYFLFDGERLQAVPKKKKEIKAFFSARCPQAMAALEEAGVRFKDKEDLIRAVIRCNQ